MNKRKQSPITKNLDDIIKEASLHSEKRLKENSFHRFTKNAKPLSTYENTSKNSVKENKNTPKHTKKNQLKDDKRIKSRSTKNNDNVSAKNSKNDSDIKSKKAMSFTRNTKKDSPNKQRKRIGQKDASTQQNTYVSIIDNRISMKKLRGKSILCVGAVRSGKSDFALAWANTFEGNKAFIATMQTPHDFKIKQNARENEKKRSPNLEFETYDNTKKKKEQKQYSASYNDVPSYFQDGSVKNAYRIHTHFDSDISQFPYSINPHTGSKKKFEKNEDIEEQFPIDHVQNSVKEESLQNNMELEKRISQHQMQRGKSWITIEEPTDIVGAIHKAKERKCTVVIIDCLTLWLTNLMLQDKTDKQIFNKIEELTNLLKNPPIPLVIVTNEVGAGIVPENALARRFRDLQGKANQILAKNASNVIATFCGLPLLLKG